MINEKVIRKISARLNEPEWMLDRRLEAFEKFKELSMPSFRYGIGISVDVSELKFDEMNPLDDKSRCKINASDAEVFGFNEAFENHENLLRENFMTKCVLASEDKFTTFHAAFFNSGVLIRIPENVETKNPIELYLDFNGKVRMDHVLVIAEKNSKAVIVDYSSSKDSKGFRNQIVEIIAKENAKVEYRSVQDFAQDVYAFSKKRAQVEKDGSIQWTDCCIGGKFTQSLTKTFLKGDNAESQSLGIVFGDNKQCFDINNETIHVASRTKCNMLTKFVLNDNAKAIYRGLIRVNPKAVKCEGYQKNDTILLSEYAEADAVPNLEIENNDVKCTHGATISQVDNDKLFYMMSRGIDEISAKKQIVEGFFDPILVKIEDNDLRDKIKNNISKRLGAIYEKPHA
ncbi:Fe-S cluster assembly protein SufD [Candidatus Woesearchaeota archaeon]|nr:Fe-S cluster assembly protein SufD [Candidatus Woesearchaeota archaeon]